MKARLARLAGLPVLVCAAAFFAATTTGCPGSSSSGGFVAIPNGSGTLVVTSGNNQTGVASAALPMPLTVTLVDGSGSPLSNQKVSFAATQGGGSLSTTSTTTNVLGQASTVLTLGPKPGLNQVQATASVANVISGSLAATFSETGTSGSAANVAASSGASQTLSLGTASAPLVITVTDASGNPVSGALVVFSVTSGSGTLSTPTVVTNAQGQAQTTATPTATGTLTVTATVANAVGSSTSFTITVTTTVPSANPAVAFKVPGSLQLTGTVTPSNGSTAVVGVGTKFTTEVVIGSQAYFASQPGTTYTVAAIADDLHLTLSANYTGTTPTSGVSLTVLGFTEPRGIAVSQKSNALWITAVYNGTIASVASPSVILKTTKSGGLTVNTPPIAMPSIPGTANLAEPIALALSLDESTLYVLDLTPTATVGSNPRDTAMGVLYQVGANGGPLVSVTSGTFGGTTTGLALGQVDAPTAMVISPDGQHLYVTGYDFPSHEPGVFALDLNPKATNSILNVTSALAGTLVQPTGIGVSLDGKTLYVADAGGPNGAQLFSLSASGGVTALTPLGSIADATRVGGGIVPGFDGGVNVVATSGAQGKLTSIPTGGGSESVRTTSTGSGPLVSPFQCARDSSRIYTVDSEATGDGCVVVSQ